MCYDFAAVAQRMKDTRYLLSVGIHRVVGSALMISQMSTPRVQSAVVMQLV